MTHGVKQVKDRDVSSGRPTRLVVSESGTVRLTCSRSSQRGSHGDGKALCQAGRGPVSWARSEGLEPPTF